MATSASDYGGVFSANSRKRARHNESFTSLPSLPPPAVSRDEEKPEQASTCNDNPFGLKVQAKEWLKDELEKKLPGSIGSEESSHYVPYDASCNHGMIPAAHWDKAYSEFRRCFMDSTSSTVDGRSVLLVATNLEKSWTPGEEMLKGKYLFFPAIEYYGKTISALFISYMPGPEHGAADAYVSHTIGSWRLGSPLLRQVLNSGLSSGTYANPQPDLRVFPKRKYKNYNDKDDLDKRNGNVPYSRFIWEVEWKNRSPLDIRRNGKVLMKSNYNRLYLAAKLYGVDDDGKMEAAMFLWGREEGNDIDIKVMHAISFGTKDLSQEHKEEFSKDDCNCLVGVSPDAWIRPTDIPQDYPNTDETLQDLVLKIPLEGILHKVTYKTADMDEPRFLSELVGEQKITVPNLEIDLRELLQQVLDVAVTD